MQKNSKAGKEAREHGSGQSWRSGRHRRSGKTVAQEGVWEPTQGEGKQDDTRGTLTDDRESCAKGLKSQGGTESQMPGDQHSRMLPRDRVGGKRATRKTSEPSTAVGRGATGRSGSTEGSSGRSGSERREDCTLRESLRGGQQLRGVRWNLSVFEHHEEGAGKGRGFEGASTLWNKVEQTVPASMERPDRQRGRTPCSSLRRPHGTKDAA